MSPRTVWLASYPKSGSTWTRAVVQALANGGGVDINAIEVGSTSAGRPMLDARLGFASSDLRHDEIEAVRLACEAVEDRAGTGLRLRKIHDAFRGPGGSPIVPVAATRAAVYLIRDPRDVAVSYAHFLRRDPDWAVDRLGDPASVLADPQFDLTSQVPQRLGTWSGHVTGWTEHGLFPVAVIRYEDLSADPARWFARVARVAGLAASDADVVAAVEAARFDRLCAQEAEHGFRERSGAAVPFFRRGVVDAWRDELPSGLARRIEAEHGAVMARFGYLSPG